ncbi:MAG: cytochrome c biogenesis protein ResB [Deltaproteobacteria bacterium]|nr:cytochrome c biogenesis protein ResB [Deltaproteobacteria bacterium]
MTRNGEVTSAVGPRRWAASLWLAISSTRTTAFLVIALAMIALASAVIPQGGEALILARSEHATRLHALIAWGLTDLFESAWFKAFAVLLVTNVTAAALRLVASKVETGNLVRVPATAPLSTTLRTSVPERAVDILRRTCRAFLRVAPAAEVVEGARVTMVFDTTRGGSFAPLFAHLGLLLLVTGAASATTVDPASTIPYGRFEIKDMRSQKVGRFDMVANEPFQLFQWRAQYTLKTFRRDLGGLGPAVQFEKAEPDQPGSTFWVYLLAPNEFTKDGRTVFFDEKHRGDVVAFRALDMGERPLPGEGFGASSAAVLMVLGVGLLLIGMLVGSRVPGRFWILADGDVVRLVGVPQQSEDSGFARGFDRLALITQAALRDD